VIKYLLSTLAQLPAFPPFFMRAFLSSRIFLTAAAWWAKMQVKKQKNAQEAREKGILV